MGQTKEIISAISFDDSEIITCHICFEYIVLIIFFSVCGRVPWMLPG